MDIKIMLLWERCGQAKKKQETSIFNRKNFDIVNSVSIFGN